MISCDCSCSCDADDYDPNDLYTAKTLKARKPHKCCECGDVIQPRQRYERVTIHTSNGWDRYETCMVCVAIRKHYCPNGWIHTELATQIDECLDFDYRTVPDESEAR